MIISSSLVHGLGKEGGHLFNIVIYDLIIDFRLDLIAIIPMGLDSHCVLSNLELKKKVKQYIMLTLQQPFVPMLNLQLYM